MASATSPPALLNAAFPATGRRAGRGPPATRRGTSLARTAGEAPARRISQRLACRPALRCAVRVGRRRGAGSVHHSGSQARRDRNRSRATVSVRNRYPRRRQRPPGARQAPRACGQRSPGRRPEPAPAFRRAARPETHARAFGLGAGRDDSGASHRVRAVRARGLFGSRRSPSSWRFRSAPWRRACGAPARSFRRPSRNSRQRARARRGTP